MRLQVEQNLQTMFDFSQETIVGFQARTFLHIKATHLFQRGNGFQGITCAHLRQVTTVKELQKLNDKFDITQATMACFNVTKVVGVPNRETFNLSFQRFDTSNISSI